MQRLGYGPAQLRNKKRLRECMRDLANNIDATYYHLRRMISDKEADPARVRTALRGLEIAIQEDAGLLKHQRDYLLKALRLSSEGISLDQAFGITRRRRGAPPKDLQEQINIAVDVLRAMLKGRNLESAAIEAAPNWNVGPTQARKYWAENKFAAVRQLRLERGSGERWNRTEAERLRRLLAKDIRIVQEFIQGEDGKILPPRPIRRKKTGNKLA
jgi:hypothetical protein